MSVNPVYRNSSIELYRIIATFAVLIVHFNGWFVNGPLPLDANNFSAMTIGQMIIQSATCICVNMFILVSGYFSMKLRLKSIVNLCVKLLFIFVPLYLVFALYYNEFRMNEFAHQFLVVTRAGWFIQCYLMLMFLSPALNAFTEKYGKSIIPWCIVFLIIEFWFECIMANTKGSHNSFNFNMGYSVIHFVLIYMLGRCIFLIKEDVIKVKRFIWLLGYIGCTLLICLLYVIDSKFTWYYSNPLVVISSVFTFLPFLYKDFRNTTINWIAEGTLAVYIIHSNTPVVDILMKIDYILLNTYNYCTYLFFSISVIIVVFIGCVIYDKLSSLFYKPLLNKVLKSVESNFNYN